MWFCGWVATMKTTQREFEIMENQTVERTYNLKHEMIIIVLWYLIAQKMYFQWVNIHLYKNQIKVEITR